MEIEVELTEDDYKEFSKAYGLYRNWIRKSVLLILADIVLCKLLGIGNSAILLVFIILGGILFFFFFQLPYLNTKKRFRVDFINDLSCLSKKIYKPFAAGIEIIEKNENRFLRYEGIKKIGKTGHYIYLILFDGSYYLLPDWCFSSSNDIDHFLRIIKNGSANINGSITKEPLTFKPIYLIGIICFIPLLGAFAGIVLIILGLAHYKDRVFVIMGSVGVAITVFLYGSLIYFSQHNGGAVENGFADISQSQINDLVKNIEFYKMQNDAYPDSLKQLQTKDSFLSIDDPLQAIKNNGKSTEYQYHKKGNRYLLFSVGKDGIPNTKDDIYPTFANADTSKLGFIRQKIN